MTTLEKEFEKKKEYHKYIVIASSLILFEDNGIYDCPLLKEYESTEGTGEEKAFAITDDLEERANKNTQDKERYEKIYEMCWKHLRNKID